MEERRNSITISGVLVGLIIGIVLLSGIYIFINKDSIFGSKNNSNETSNGVNSNSQTVSIKEDDTKDYVYDAEYNNHNMPNGYVKGKASNNSKRISNDIFNSIEVNPSDPQSFDDMKVPYINIKGAQAINKMIEHNYLDYVQEFVYYTSNSDEPLPTRSVLTYYTYTSDDVLSIIIAYGQAQTTPISVNYSIFNYDLKTGKLLSNDELIQNLGFINIDEQVKNQLSGFIENDWLSDSRHERVFNFGSGEIDIVEYNVNAYLNNSKDRLMYVDSDGNLNVIVFLELGGEIQLRKSFVVSK